MIELPFLVLVDQGGVLLLDLGVILLHAVQVVDHQRGLSSYGEDLHILNVFTDVGCELRLNRILALHCDKYLLEFFLHATELTS